MEKLEATGHNQLPAFEYEFNRKHYASFNNYNIIPPIKNKGNNDNQDASIQAKIKRNAETHVDLGRYVKVQMMMKQIVNKKDV